MSLSVLCVGEHYLMGYDFTFDITFDILLDYRQHLFIAPFAPLHFVALEIYGSVGIE